EQRQPLRAAIHKGDAGGDAFIETELFDGVDADAIVAVDEIAEAENDRVHTLMLLGRQVREDWKANSRSSASRAAAARRAEILARWLRASPGEKSTAGIWQRYARPANANSDCAAATISAGLETWASAGRLPAQASGSPPGHAIRSTRISLAPISASRKTTGS